MRFGFLAMILASLGAGNYAYTELSPLTPEQRVEKIQALPLVREYIAGQQTRLVKKAFQSDEDGILTFEDEGQMWVWGSADSLLKDALEGSPWAKQAIEQLKNAKVVGSSDTEAKRMAGGAGAAGLFQHYQSLGTSGDLPDLERVLAQMGGSNSAMANGLAGSLGSSGLMNQLDPFTKEGQKDLLQMFKDQIQTAGSIGGQGAASPEQMQNLEQFIQDEENVAWIMARLHGDTNVRVRVPK